MSTRPGCSELVGDWYWDPGSGDWYRVRGAEIARVCHYTHTWRAVASVPAGVRAGTPTYSQLEQV